MRWPLLPPVANGTLTPTYGSSGLSALSFNGSTFGASADPTASILYADGSSPANANASSRAWDATTHTRTIRYTWGSIAVTYAAQANRLDFTFSITNSGAQTIRGFDAVPIHLTEITAQDDKQSTYTAPARAVVTYTDGQLALVYNGSAQINAVLWIQRITGGCFVRFATIQPFGKPADPDIRDHPIAAGETQTYSLSLRFAEADASLRDLAIDAYLDFARHVPFKMHWLDNRPIGALFSARTQSRTAVNPNGYRLGNTQAIDVTTATGLIAFRSLWFAYIDGAISVARQTNAQAIIIWDIEGNQYDQFLYYGDPERVEELAPEMAYQTNGVKLVDEIFARIRAAGLKFGLTIRPQDITLTAGVPSATYPASADHAANFIRKINYCRDRWGCCIFYIDSTDAQDVSFVMQQVHAACPDALLMPENENPAMRAVSMPFDDIGSGQIGPTSDQRYAYPRAADAISVMPGGYDALRQRIFSQVYQGSLLIYHGDSDHITEALWVRDLYRDVATIPPTRTGQLKRRVE